MRCCVTFNILPSRFGSVVSARDLAELARFYSVEPWDEMRGDVRTAQLSLIVASALSSKGKRFKLQDFMPFLKRAYRMTADELNRVRKRYLAQHPDRFS